jgi:truncated hemoglobin YjbI
MKEHQYPPYAPSSGYMTEQIQSKYIEYAVKEKLLPVNAHRMPHVISLQASADQNKPIQFWQLYSVMGAERIIDIVTRFYNRVYTDEDWFKSVFEGISGKQHHINTQSSMWIDAMGGGHRYHGGEFRLSFHHTHNAFALMNDRGAHRWVSLMRQTLDEPGIDYTADLRVRPAVNTFLSYFMDKYAAEFNLKGYPAFGQTNPPLKRRLNFLNMTSEEIENLDEWELHEELTLRGIDTQTLNSKTALVNKALNL